MYKSNDSRYSEIIMLITRAPRAIPRFSRIYASVTIAVAIALSLASCARNLPPRTEFVLGTVCTINLYDKGTNRAYTAAFDRLRDIEATMSASLETSDVGRINAAAGREPVAATRDTITVLSFALETARASGGAFDPTVGPVVKLWGIGTDDARVPSSEAIEKALALVDYDRVRLDDATGMVYLEDAGMRLDLGAIAKGYAADEVARVLREKGISRAIVDLGGNILCVGEKSPGTPWTVGIRNPETSRGEPVIVVQASDSSVVTSGVYERFFEENGKRYHHIIDPKTGWPSDGELLSVTIIARESMTADALSTATFVLGREKGLALIARYPGAEAVFIDREKRVYASPGLVRNIKIIDESFELAE